MKRKRLVAVAALAMVIAVPLTRAQADSAEQSTASVTLMSDPSKVGSSTLTRTDDGLAFTLQTTRLEAGHAVTIWWMVTNPDGGMAVLYGAGHVIGAAGAGSFAGSLSVGDGAGYAMGDDTTLEDSLNATVVLIVRDHGPAAAAAVADQIHTIDTCNTTCTDQQMSVHAPS